jgi:hypothetical protein
MYNDFVIVGPAEDPAGIRGMTDVAAASEAGCRRRSSPLFHGAMTPAHTYQGAGLVGRQWCGNWWKRQA